jgi:hypothetical protein
LLIATRILSFFATVLCFLSLPIFRHINIDRQDKTDSLLSDRLEGG